MILFALPPHTVETVPAWNTAPLRAWRWALTADRWSVGAEEQVRFGETDEWGPAIRYVGLGVSRTQPEKSGFYHGYYDGPHHALWVGPFFVSWSLGWCDVCMPDPEKDTSGAVAAFIEAVLVAAVDAFGPPTLPSGAR